MAYYLPHIGGPPSGFAWKAFNNPPHYHTRRLCFLPTLEMRNEYDSASPLISKPLRPLFPTHHLLRPRWTPAAAVSASL